MSFAFIVNFVNIINNKIALIIKRGELYPHPHL